LGTGLSSGLVIFLVFTGRFSSFVLTDTTPSLIFFTSFFFGSFFFSALPSSLVLPSQCDVEVEHF
jgi:hypothetical protein